MSVYIWNAAARISELRDSVENDGIAQLHIEDDFRTFRQTCFDAKGKMHPQFDPMFMDILPHQGFWIWGEDEKGEVVHTQAIRKDDIGPSTLSTFLKQNLTRLYQGELVDTCPAAKRLSGIGCYHGEMWIKEGDLRRRGLAARLSRLALAAAMLKFNPDFVYGFMEPEGVIHGPSLRWGYGCAQPAATEWVDEPVFRAGRWIVWIERQDLMFVMAQPSSVFDVSP